NVLENVQLSLAPPTAEDSRCTFNSKRNGASRPVPKLDAIALTGGLAPNRYHSKSGVAPIPSGTAQAVRCHSKRNGASRPVPELDAIALTGGLGGGGLTFEFSLLNVLENVQLSLAPPTAEDSRCTIGELDNVLLPSMLAGLIKRMVTCG
ncbi:MAG: hypothetical protein ACKOAU_09090, partial [Pirellula sp.]